MADTPEQSEYTSIQRRIKAAIKGEQPGALLPFSGCERLDVPKGLTFDVKDYIELVDDTGRVIRDDKCGAIKPGAQKILSRLNIPIENWQKVTSEFKYLFKGPVGTLEELTRYCEHLDKKRISYASSCRHWSS